MGGLLHSVQLGRILQKGLLHVCRVPQGIIVPLDLLITMVGLLRVDLAVVATDALLAILVQMGPHLHHVPRVPMHWQDLLLVRRANRGIHLSLDQSTVPRALLEQTALEEWRLHLVPQAHMGPLRGRLVWRYACRVLAGQHHPQLALQAHAHA